MAAQTPLKNVILLGASGNIGGPILSALLGANHFNVTVAIRTGSQPPSYPSSVRTVPIDYDSPSSLATAFQGQDAIVSAVATFATPQQRAVIDAAVAAGVKRFIPSEYGMDSSDRARELVPAIAMKTDTVTYLRTKESQGLSWTALIIGAFFDWALVNGFLGYDFKNRTAINWADGEVGYETTNVGRIAEGVVRILERPEVTANEYVFVHSFRVTPNAVRGAIEKATGEKWAVKQVDLAEVYEEGKRKWDNGNEAAATDDAKAKLGEGIRDIIWSVLSGYRVSRFDRSFGLA